MRRDVAALPDLEMQRTELVSNRGGKYYTLLFNITGYRPTRTSKTSKHAVRTFHRVTVSASVLRDVRARRRPHRQRVRQRRRGQTTQG